MATVPLSCHPPAGAGKPALHERVLINQAQARELVRLYKILGSDTRLRLLHALVRADQRSVTDLADDIGMTAQAVSNQLQRLLDGRIVAARRDGNRVFYRIADPCVSGLIDLALCLAEETGRLPDPPRMDEMRP